MRISIRSKLILFIGVALLVIYGGVIGMDAYRSRGIARERLRRHLLNQARTMATRLEFALRGVSQTANQLSDDVATNQNVPQEFYWLILRRALERNHSVVSACVAFEPTAGPGGVYQFAPQVERQQEKPKNQSRVYRFGLSESPNEPIRSERTDYFDSPWYRQAILDEKGVWSEPYYDAMGQLIATFAEPIYRNGGLLGVAAVDVRVDWLRKIIERNQGKDETVLLVSRNGRFLHHPQETYVMADTNTAKGGSIPWAELAKAMTAGGEQDIRLTTPQGPAWAVFTPVPSSDWSVATILPEEKMTKPLREYVKGEVAVLLVAFVLVMLVVLVMSLSLTQRLTRLTRAVRQAELGDRHANVPGRPGNDEIGDAIRAFNRMMERLREEENKQ